MESLKRGAQASLYFNTEWLFSTVIMKKIEHETKTIWTKQTIIVEVHVVLSKPWLLTCILEKNLNRFELASHKHLQLIIRMIEREIRPKGEVYPTHMKRNWSIDLFTLNYKLNEIISYDMNQSYIRIKTC